MCVLGVSDELEQKTTSAHQETDFLLNHHLALEGVQPLDCCSLSLIHYSSNQLCPERLHL